MCTKEAKYVEHVFLKEIKLKVFRQYNLKQVKHFIGNKVHSTGPDFFFWFCNSIPDVGLCKSGSYSIAKKLSFHFLLHAMS